MEKAWAYDCQLGLYQDTCGRYQPDRESRGWRERIGGCPSCEHRVRDESRRRQRG